MSLNILQGHTQEEIGCVTKCELFQGKNTDAKDQVYFKKGENR